MNNEERDQAAAAVAKTEARVTLASINEKIVSEEYLPRDRREGETLTICVLTLRNGFQVIGRSGCADPANFNEALGQKFALQDAVAKIWPLEGYLLKESLYRERLAAEVGAAA